MMCSSVREELRRACLTSLGGSLEISFLSAALAGGVFNGRLLGGFFWLDIDQSGNAFTDYAMV